MEQGIIKRLNEERLPQSKKEANDFKWYKDHCDIFRTKLDVNSSLNFFGTYAHSSKRRRKLQVNYDLMENIIHTQDYESVISPYGGEFGELPANMANRDITISKMNRLVGMQLRRPFPYKVAAVNPEASTRREREQTAMLKKSVISQVLSPIIEEIKISQMQALGGQAPTEEQRAQMAAEAQKQLEAKTPKEVKRYMEREHQDPMEVLGHQLLEYGKQRQRIEYELDARAWKDLCVSGDEVLYVGIEHGHPVMYRLHPKRFVCGKAEDELFNENADWWVAEYRWTPDRIVARFAHDKNMTDDVIDKLFELARKGGSPISENDLDWFRDQDYHEDSTLTVYHTVWRSLTKSGLLTYRDEKNIIRKKRVGEGYILNEAIGDINIDWTYIPEIHEAYYCHGYYFQMQPCELQFRDPVDPYTVKGPYYGTMNNTCPLDLLKPFQYLFNICWYRAELAMAKDKGKIVVGNLNVVPGEVTEEDTSGLRLFHYYLEATQFSWVNPNQEGNRNLTGNIGELFKELDLTNGQQIKQYLEIAEALDIKGGRAVGLLKDLEQTKPRESATGKEIVYNTSSEVLEPYFALHTEISLRGINAFLEASRYAYAESDLPSLDYVLDDLSRKLIDLQSNREQLKLTSYGIFASTNSSTHKIQKAIDDLTMLQMQNGMADLSDIVAALKASPIEAEEILKAAEKKKVQERMLQQEQQLESAERIKAMELKDKDKERKHKEKLEHIKGAYNLRRQGIFSSGFAENQDVNQNKVPDTVENAEQAAKAADAEAERLQSELDRIDKQENKKKSE